MIAPTSDGVGLMYHSETHAYRRLILLFLTPVIVFVVAIFLFFQQFSVPDVHATEPPVAADTPSETTQATDIIAAPASPSPVTTTGISPSDQALTFLILLTAVCVVIATTMIVYLQLYSRGTNRRIAAALDQQTRLERQSQQQQWLRQEIKLDRPKTGSSKIIDLQKSLELP